MIPATEALMVNFSVIANSSNVTNVIASTWGCEFQLHSVGYTFMPYSYGTTAGSMIVLILSGVLNAYSIMMVKKEERYSLHNVLLLNIFVADLCLGSVLDVFMAISALKVNVCLARIVLQITFFIFTDVTFLSLAFIAFNQAKQVRRLFDFTQNRNQSNQTQVQLMFKVAIIWLYSSIISLVVSFSFPKIWFFQVILIFIFILVLHWYTLKKLNGVVPSDDSVLLQRRMQVIRKAQKSIIALLLAEVLTWIPFVLAVVLHLFKVIKPHQIDETLFWTIDITYLAPLFNPVVLFLIRDFECRRDVSNVRRNAAEMIEMRPVG